MVGTYAIWTFSVVLEVLVPRKRLTQTLWVKLLEIQTTLIGGHLQVDKDCGIHASNIFYQAGNSNCSFTKV